MPELAERVTDVEFHLAQLAHAQLKTEMELQRLSREMREFKDEMSDFKVEMSEFKVEMSEFKNEMLEFKNEMLEFKNEMKEFKNEMSDFKNEMSDFKNEMSDFKREALEERKRMNKAWGDLANKMGTVLEDIVAPNIKRLASERFDCDPLESFSVGSERRGPDGIMREFDVIAVGARRVLLAESKSTITEKSVADVVEKARIFFDHFPEWRGRELIPLLATFRVKAPSHAALNAHRIYGVEMGDDTMVLINDGEF